VTNQLSAIKAVAVAEQLPLGYVDPGQDIGCGKGKKAGSRAREIHEIT
jgi:hypothetical protein